MPNKEITVSTLTSNQIDTYIANWDGSDSSGLSAAGSSHPIQTIISYQLKSSDISFFQDSFINYNEGLLLCVNTKKMLNTSVFNDIKNPLTLYLTFRVVRMPRDFKGLSPTKISTKYSVGEKIRISSTFESEETEVGNTSISATKFLYYRDVNIRGRSKASSSVVSGGGGIGVWS